MNVEADVLIQSKTVSSVVPELCSRAHLPTHSTKTLDDEVVVGVTIVRYILAAANSKIIDTYLIEDDNSARGPFDGDGHHYGSQQETVGDTQDTRAELGRGGHRGQLRGAQGDRLR